MSISPHVLWLSVSPSLKRFDRPLIRVLAQHTVLAHWEYLATPDEPCSLDLALEVLHNYLHGCDRPPHVVGHGLSGWLGLEYARRYPEQVASLTLLGVGVYPAVDWQAHYYAQRRLLPCSQWMLLTQMVRNLFGPAVRPIVKELVDALAQDLETSPSPHSLLYRHCVPPGGSPVPLLVCGSANDVVADPHQLQGWQPWLKPGDRLWMFPSGYHFFHYFFPHEVQWQVLRFWRSLALSELGTELDLEVESEFGQVLDMGMKSEPNMGRESQSAACEQEIESELSLGS